MQLDYYAKYFAFESDDWWFVGRRRIVLGLLDDSLGRNGQAVGGLRILDAGAGTAITLGELCRRGTAFGIDVSGEAIRFSRLRGHHRLIQTDLACLGLAGDSFDVVTCLDVLEHVVVDATAAREIFRVCRPGGVVAITVPAFRFLWSEHDVINHHLRRYRRKSLRGLVEGAGFEVELLSFYNFWLSPLATGLRLLKRAWTAAFPGVVRRIESDNTYLPRSINWLFATIFASELRLLRRMSLPYGISLVCIVRKPRPSSRS